MNDPQNKESALEQRIAQLIKYMTIGLACLILVGIMSGFSFWKVSQEKEVAVQNQQVQAETTKQSSWCSIYPDDDVCEMAREIVANPTVTVVPQDGKDGKNGQDGKGVTTFDVSDAGDLIVTFTDGTIQNYGHIIGKNGIDGINGKDGRGILSVTIDRGNLMIGFTDGVTENLGIVVGPAGQDGLNGLDGATGANGNDGAPGVDGISVLDLQVDPAGFVNVSYSDGTVRPAGRIIVNTVQMITCEDDTFTMKMVDGTSLSTTVDCTPDAVPAPPSAPIPPSANTTLIP